MNPGPPIHEPKDVLFVPRRRKALAEWLTSPDHPLLGRVMVNRIWQGHFGEGIVRTPNDFGRQGDRPRIRSCSTGSPSSSPSAAGASSRCTS
jgi:hypothetical protein